MCHEIFIGDERCCRACLPDTCIYRCVDCGTGRRESKSCMLARHEDLPLHRIEVRTSGIRVRTVPD
jgi:hypothetical protein